MEMLKSGIPYKSKRINFALTPQEYDACHIAAGAMGITCSQLLRMLILKEYQRLLKESFFENLNLENPKNIENEV